MDMIAMWFGTRLKTERKQVSHVILQMVLHVKTKKLREQLILQRRHEVVKGCDIVWTLEAKSDGGERDYLCLNTQYSVHGRGEVFCHKTLSHDLCLLVEHTIYKY